MGGNRWTEQITALRNILKDLSAISLNRVSLLVFNTKPIYCIDNSKISDVNLNEIKFPGGGTIPAAAFIGGNAIMKKYIGKANLYFIYITDGDGEYPIVEIKEML
jgi:hypothetical protein